jgi:hypothetical protein
MLINEIDQVDDAADYQAGHPEFEELTLEGDSGEQIELIAPRMELVPETVPWLQRKETVRYMGADFSGWSEEELTRRINVEGVLDGEPMNWRIYEVDRVAWQTGPDRAD